MSTASEPTTDPGPFGIDGPEYSDRDREMFVLGYEYRNVCEIIAADGPDRGFTVHQANVPRLTAFCEGMGHHVEVYLMADGWCRFGVNRRS